LFVRQRKEITVMVQQDAMSDGGNGYWWWALLGECKIYSFHS